MVESKDSSSPSLTDSEHVAEFEHEMKILETSCCLLNQIDFQENVADSSKDCQRYISQATKSLKTLVQSQSTDRLDEIQHRHTLINSYFQLMYLTNLNIKNLVLESLYLLVQKEKNLNSKIDLLGIVQQLTALDVKLEHIEFRTETCRLEYRPFFEKLFLYINDLVSNSAKELKSLEMHEIKIFLRVVGYCLLCVPFSHNLAEFLPNVLEFIFSELNLVSFRLTLCIAFNFFNQFDPATSDNEYQALKWTLLKSTNHEAIGYLASNLAEQNSDLRFQSETFRICIRRLNHLSSYFCHQFKNIVPNTTQKVLINQWLKLLVKDQISVKNLIDKYRRRVTSCRDLVFEFITMHMNLFHNLMEMLNIRSILLEESGYDYQGHLMEMSKISSDLSHFEQIGPFIDVQVDLLIQTITVLSITNRFNWIGEIEPPGHPDFWLAIVKRWKLSGFELISNICNAENRPAHCSKVAKRFVNILREGLEYQLENHKNSNFTSLLNPQFLKAVTTLVRVYDESQFSDTLVQDFKPLLNIIGDLFCSVRLGQDMYDLFITFYTNIFDNPLIKTPSDYWQKHIELILIKIGQFFSLFEYERTSTAQRLVENTINLLAKIKDLVDVDLQRPFLTVLECYLNDYTIKRLFLKNEQLHSKLQTLKEVLYTRIIY